MTDSTLIFNAFLTASIACAFLLYYLLRQKGSIFDPISISWAGYLAFVPGGLLTSGLYSPVRSTSTQASYAGMLLILGTLAYGIGVHSIKGRAIARRIPTPAPTLTSTQIFAMWIISVPCFLAVFLGGSVIPSALINVLKGLVMGFLGTVVLLSLLGVFSRQSILLKVLMVGSTLACSYIVLTTSWSRRPLVAMLAAAFGFVYRERIMRKSFAFRTAFITATIVGCLALIQFLTITRGNRFYGTGTTGSLVSTSAFQSLFGGIQINYNVYEYIIDNFPERREYLMGSGFVPGFLFWIPRSFWPDKPWSTGWIVTQMWYGEQNPSNNLAPIYIGEAYANFGVFGVVVILFLTGMFVRTVNTYLRERSNNQVVWLAWLLVIPDFASEWRGDFSSMTVQLLLRIIVFLGLAWVVGNVFKTPVPVQPQPGYRLYSPAGYR